MSFPRGTASIRTQESRVKTHHRGSEVGKGSEVRAEEEWDGAERDARKGEGRLKDVRRPREEWKGCPTLFSTKIIAIYARNPLYSRVVSNYNCSGARASSASPPSPSSSSFSSCPSWASSSPRRPSRGPHDARFSLFRLRSSSKPRKTAHNIPPIIASARRVTPATSGPRPKAEPGTTPAPRSTWTRR